MKVFLSEANYHRQLRNLPVLDDPLILNDLKNISGGFNVFLRKYVKGQDNHGLKMAYAIKKIMLEVNFEYVALFQNFINIMEELKANGIVVGDVDNPNNWGLKNGHLAVFDIGYGENWDHVEGLETISEEDERLHLEDVEQIVSPIAKKMGLKVIDYLGGQTYGHAYEVNGGRVLKFTRDQTEARNCSKIIGKELEYIANVYKVYKVYINGKKRYIILLEKLDTKGIHEIIADYNQIDNFIYYLWNVVKSKTGK